MFSLEAFFLLKTKQTKTKQKQKQKKTFEIKYVSQLFLTEIHV